MAVLQLDPATGGPFAYLGTFLLAAAYYALTAHIAARYVLGDVPVRRALVVGVVPAFLSLLLREQGPAIVVPVTLAVDFLAIRTVYGLALRSAGLVALVHYAVSLLLGIVLINLWRLLSAAPA